MVKMELPNKRYKLILADPPWKYENGHTGRDMKHGVDDEYLTMSVEELKTFPISSISLDDSYLFMWVTSPLLPEGIEVFKSWGYEYKAALYWDKKTNGGLGHWLRGCVEICLIGKKGNVPPIRGQYPNIIRQKISSHSRKPDKLYEIIESTHINPKIELFAREKREGWDAWGNQVPNHCQKLLTKVDA